MVLSENISIDFRSDKLSVGSGLNRRDFVSSFLYFDEILLLTNNYIGITHLEEWYVILKDEGYIKTDTIKVHEYDNKYYGLYKETINKISELMKVSSENWVASNVHEKFILKENHAAATGGERLSLVNSLPVPSDDIHIDKIIRFKQDRRDEFIALSTHINSLERRVISSGGSSDDLRIAIDEIDIACANLIRVYNERGLKFNLAKFDINFSFDKIKKSNGIYLRSY